MFNCRNIIYTMAVLKKTTMKKKKHFNHRYQPIRILTKCRFYPMIVFNNTIKYRKTSIVSLLRKKNPDSNSGTVNYKIKNLNSLFSKLNVPRSTSMFQIISLLFNTTTNSCCNFVNSFISRSIFNESQTNKNGGRTKLRPMIFTFLPKRLRKT